MTSSVILYLEDVVGHEVPGDALTILLLVNVVRHTDLLSGGKKHSLHSFSGQICNCVHFKTSSTAARSAFMF